MNITYRAPCRVDLSGGTLDIWPLFLFHEGATTVNFAVNLYASCLLKTRADKRIVLRSSDLRSEEVFESLDHLAASSKYRLPLLAYAVRFFQPEMGLEVSTVSEAPAGAGISGSSALMIAISSALNKLTGAGYPLERIREISQNIEAQVIRVPTGCQDYYPAMYGGVGAIELSPAGVKRVALSVKPEDLESRTVLVYTGKPRNSGINNWEVMKAHIDGEKRVHRSFEQIAAIARAMRISLSVGDWSETARLIREEWLLRRKNVPGITTELIDALVAGTKKAGAKAAKVCGAGGGGCVFILVEPDAKANVQSVVQSLGAQILDVKVARRGVSSRNAGN